MQWIIPDSSKGKRPASQPFGRVRKVANAGQSGADRHEIASMGSVRSEAPPLGGLLTSLGNSTKSPDNSQIEELESMGVTEYMLMLLLQTSRRLADLESTTYYTHMLPVSNPLYTKLENTYQSYLHAVQQNKDHLLGPPMIHRYLAMLEYLVGEESLKTKPGLAPLLATASEFVTALKENQSFADLDVVVDAFGHCKIHKAYDKQVVKIQFVGPYLVKCGDVTTTLGSVTSRLLRSVNVPRKNGTAPMGHMERHLQEILQARKTKK